VPRGGGGRGWETLLLILPGGENSLKTKQKREKKWEGGGLTLPLGALGGKVGNTERKKGRKAFRYLKGEAFY